MLLQPDSPLSICWHYLPQFVPWLLRFMISGRPKRVGEISMALSALLKDSLHAYQQLLNDVNCSDLICDKGIVMTAATDQSLKRLDPILKLRKRQGVLFEQIGSEQLQHIFPGIDSRIKHGIYFKSAGHILDPKLLVSRLANCLKESGGTILRQRAIGFKNENGDIKGVQTDNEFLPAKYTVLCAGARSKSLAEKLGSKIPLDTERGYSLTLPEPGFQITTPIISSDHYFAITPMANGLRLAGTVEFGGLRAPPNPKRYQLILRQAKSLFNTLQSNDAQLWMGHRPSMPDSLPVIGRSPKFRNAILAFGHGHIGLTTAVVTGQIVSDIISQRISSVDIDPFRPERFS